MSREEGTAVLEFVADGAASGRAAVVVRTGTVLHYSIGFDVMALVIERVTGMPYGTFLERRLWRPLDMRSTGFQVARKDAGRLATGDINPPGVADPSEGVGAGTRALMRAAPIIPPGMVGGDG